VDFNEGAAAEIPRGVRSAGRNLELGNYKGLELELPTMDVTERGCGKRRWRRWRERAATFGAGGGRAIQDGDFAQVRLLGTPARRRGPVAGGERASATSARKKRWRPFNTEFEGRKRRGPQEF